MKETKRKQAEEALLKAGALQSAIFNSANFSSIATDAKGVIQIFNVGAERMLGYAAADVMNKITPADISDPQEVIARATALSTELGTPITPGFEALVFKASRGIEDIYELTYIRKDGSRFPAVVSVTALRDAQDTIIGYLLIGTDNTARKRAEEAVRQAHADLEMRVIERTAELARANESLRSEEEHLRLSEDRYRDLVEHSGDLIYTHDLDGKILWANPAAERFTGYSREALLGMNLADLFTRGTRDAFPAYLAEIRTKGAAHGVMRVRTATGETRWWEFDNTLRIEGMAAPVVRGLAQDVTERKAAEATIQRQTQLYAALSECNKAIVRCVSEEELFAQVCRAAVQFGGMKMAWIGVIDAKIPMVRPAASFGDGAEDLQDIEMPVDAGSLFGRGPIAAVIRENQPYWCQDFLNDPVTALWRERGARFGWRASAALPLHRNGVVIGAFVVNAGEVNAFDKSASDLLLEMAGDISFALDNFDRESRRKRADEGLRAAEEQFRGLVEQAIAGIYIIQDGKLVYVNPRLAEILDQGSADELIGIDPLLLIVEADRGKVAENMRRLLDGEERSFVSDFSVLRRDGIMIQVGVNGARATHEGRPAIIGLLQDISEKRRAEVDIQRYIEQLKAAFMSTVDVASIISEMRDPYTAGHERRVAQIAVAIGAALGFDERRQEGLAVSGRLHDIGKVTIPAEILSKPGKLSAIEFQLIQGHAQAGYDVLKDVKFPWPVAQVALQHHERADGSGYPQGLKGEAILLEARIMAVADVVEAMSSHRPYRPGLGIDKALAEIERGRGSAFDTDVADACLRLFRETGFKCSES